MFVNAVLRNALEGFHHDHLSDARMRELNPIIRNAVYTAIHAVRSMRRSKLASRWVMFQMMYIASYWEQPELLEAYVNSIDPKNQWLDALLRGELAPSITIDGRLRPVECRAAGRCVERSVCQEVSEGLVRRRFLGAADFP